MKLPIMQDLCIFYVGLKITVDLEVLSEDHYSPGSIVRLKLSHEVIKRSQDNSNYQYFQGYYDK